MTKRPVGGLTAPRRSKTFPKGDIVVAAVDYSQDCCLEVRKSITQPRVDSRRRILSVRICFKCVLRRGKDLIVLLAFQGRQRRQKHRECLPVLEYLTRLAVSCRC